MADVTLNLNPQKVVAGTHVKVASVPYLVADNLTISIPDTVTPEEIAALGDIVVPAGVTANPEPVLISTRSVDGQVLTKQNLYTVPAGRVFVPTSVVMRGASATLAGATLGFGFDSVATDYAAAAAIADPLATATAVLVVEGLNPRVVGAAAAVFGVKFTVASTDPATVTIDVIGYLANA